METFWFLVTYIIILHEIDTMNVKRKEVTK